MDEKQEKTTTPNQSTETAEDPDNRKPNIETDAGAGNENVGETSILNKVIKENERMEANIKKNEEIIKKQEEIAANAILAGRSVGGGTAPQLSEEDKKKAGAKEFFKGTELEKAIDKI